MPVLSGSLSHVNLTYWYTPVKLKLVTVLELENVLVALAAPSMVISNQSVDAVGLADIEPCTLKEPVKSPLAPLVWLVQIIHIQKPMMLVSARIQ